MPTLVTSSSPRGPYQQRLMHERLGLPDPSTDPAAQRVKLRQLVLSRSTSFGLYLTPHSKSVAAFFRLHLQGAVVVNFRRKARTPVQRLAPLNAATRLSKSSRLRPVLACGSARTPTPTPGVEESPPPAPQTRRLDDCSADRTGAGSRTPPDEDDTAQRGGRRP
jgi:hypothetical protein